MEDVGKKRAEGAIQALLLRREQNNKVDALHISRDLKKNAYNPHRGM